MQIKICLKILRESMVKNGYDQSGNEILTFTVSEKWTNGITDFLHVDMDSQKYKADQNIFGGYGQRQVWPVWSWHIVPRGGKMVFFHVL